MNINIFSPLMYNNELILWQKYKILLNLEAKWRVFHFISKGELHMTQI